MIELRNLTKKKISKKRIDDIARAFFKKYKIDPETEISLAVVSDNKMKEINSTYRGKDKTTDVLSFPELNEVIISLSQIERQAKESGRRLWQEFDFILVHGLLHLVGYTDDLEKDRLKMIKLGEEFLQELKSSNFSSKEIKLKKAFTLIEMMIVLFIVGILSSIVVANYNAGYSTTDLINSQNTIQQNLKLTQSYALNNKPYNGVVPTYWGMNFSAPDQKIYLFADLNGNYLPDTGEMDAVYGGKEIVLPSGLTFRNSFNIATVTALFTPGSGEMIAYDSDSAALNYLEWRVEISDKHFNIGKVVVFQPGYLIDNASCSCSDASVACCSFCGAGSSCNDTEWSCGLPINDPRDGQQYSTVQIGTQCWMTKNMNYDNGCSTKPSTSATDTGWCGCYSNNASNCTTYGKLYQWSAAMASSTTEEAQGICPTGWHVPSSAEQTTLNNAIGANVAYRCSGSSTYIAKAMSTTSGWNVSANTCAVGNNQSTNNTAAFNIPASGRKDNLTFTYMNGGHFSWLSTQGSGSAYYLGLFTDSSIVSITTSPKYNSYSVRCIKNQ